MPKLLWKKHPFPLLLYLEWILIGVAILVLFSLFSRPRPFSRLPDPREIEQLGALLSIAALGAMGLRLPFGSRLVQGLYITAGFGLIWLAVLLGGRGARIFPALMLIVVIRACLLFPWCGRLIVALFAYASFGLVQLLSLLQIRPFGVPLGRPLPPPLRRLPPEQLQGVLVGLTLNSALLFGLVLGFVLLLVGAVLAEAQSRDKLAIANRRLRQYALMVENQATLQERNRIAREIHDSVGHALTAQSIQLENVGLFLAENPEQADYHLQKARQLGKEALQSVRQSVRALRQSPWQGRSLAAALEKLIEEFERTNRIEVETSLRFSAPLSAEMAAALYRVIQEALTNISKHSRATQVSLRLEEKPGSLELRIEDNGRGFNLAENKTGFGLQGMRERIQALSGTFALRSQPGQGCKIQAEIPLFGELV